MKKLLFSLLLSVFCFNSYADEWDMLPLSADYFPDEYFRAYLSQVTGVSEGEEFDYSAITSINITPETFADYDKVMSLDGHYFFFNLSTVIMSNPNIETIDVGEHTTLSVVDVTGCTNLKTLIVSGYIDGHIKELDLTNQTKLEYLDCNFNELKTLDLSHNTNLRTLRCAYNQLTTLDLSNNNHIDDLFIAANNISSIVYPELLPVYSLYCHENKLTSLDLTRMPYLQELDADSNELTELSAAPCPNLHALWVSGNKLESIDVTSNLKLQDIDVSYNKISAVDFSNNTKLAELVVMDNKLTEIDVTMLPNLRMLNIAWNEISTVDLSNNSKIENLMVNDTKISEVDLSNLNSLMALSVFNMPIKRLDVSGASSLMAINMSNTEMTHIDLSANRIILFTCEGTHRLVPEEEYFVFDPDFNVNYVSEVEGGEIVTLDSGLAAFHFNEGVTEASYRYNPQCFRLGYPTFRVTLERSALAGVKTVKATEADVTYYNLNGVQVPNPRRGDMVIKQTTMTDGSKTTKRILFR